MSRKLANGLKPVLLIIHFDCGIVDHYLAMPAIIRQQLCDEPHNTCQRTHLVGSMRRLPPLQRNGGWGRREGKEGS